MKKIFYAICLIALITSPVFAAQAGSSGGSISLDDTNGGGPGVGGIAVSANSYANYTGASGAGGNAGIAGQVMASSAASLKADKAVALYMAARSSMDPAFPDDNSIYQLPANGTAVATGTVDANLLLDYPNVANWLVRGGS